MLLVGCCVVCGLCCGAFSGWVVGYCCVGVLVGCWRSLIVSGCALDS